MFDSNNVLHKKSQHFTTQLNTYSSSVATVDTKDSIIVAARYEVMNSSALWLFSCALQVVLLTYLF